MCSTMFNVKYYVKQHKLHIYFLFTSLFYLHPCFKVHTLFDKHTFSVSVDLFPMNLSSSTLVPVPICMIIYVGIIYYVRRTT